MGPVTFVILLLCGLLLIAGVLAMRSPDDTESTKPRPLRTCPQCGYLNPAQARFCAQCGKHLGSPDV